MYSLCVKIKIHSKRGKPAKEGHEAQNTAKTLVTQPSTLEDSRPNFTSRRGEKNNLKTSKITNTIYLLLYIVFIMITQ